MRSLVVVARAQQQVADQANSPTTKPKFFSMFHPCLMRFARRRAPRTPAFRIDQSRPFPSLSRAPSAALFSGRDCGGLAGTSAFLFRGGPMAQTSHACPCSLAHHSGTWGDMLELPVGVPTPVCLYLRKDRLAAALSGAGLAPSSGSVAEWGGNPLHFRLNNQGASVADYFNATGTGAAPHTIL